MALLSFASLCVLLILPIFGELDRLHTTCKGCNFTCVIKENSRIGTDVFALSTMIANSSDVHIVKASISDGNEDNRFAVSTVGVYVIRLLDYNIQSEYNLRVEFTVSFAGNRSFSIDYMLLKVVVDDVTTWPPIYNESCAVPNRQNTEKGLLYKISVGRKPLEFFQNDVYDYANIDTFNDNCNAYVYAPVNVGTRVSPFAIQHWKIECNTMKTALDIHVLPRNESSIIANKFVDQKWFKDDSSHRYAVLTLNMLHMSTKRDIDTCTLVLTSPDESERQIVPFTDSVEINPTGCPFGKYGFKCEEQCNCQNGSTCHPFNGACKCQPGWKGPACDIARTDITPKVTSVTYGGIFLMVCHHYGNPVKDHHEDVRWFLNGRLIDEDDDPRWNTKHINEGLSSFTILSVRDSDAGIFECQPRESRGLASSRASSELILTGCPEGNWGNTCDNVCGCQHGSKCDRYKGCVCKRGWNGTTCSEDVERPSVTYCPGNIVLDLDEERSNFTVTWKEPIFNDNDINNLSIMSDFLPGDVFQYGKHEVTYTATDSGNNTAVCSFLVDVQKPGKGLSKAVVGVLFMLLALLCLVGPCLGYKYRLEIQTLIADKFRPYEDDDGKLYDAFVSVKGNTPDESFVYRILLPTLEQQYGFRLCLHHRDFVVGTATVENIITSIKESRRTILILSPAFVESEWCDYEVLQAYEEMVNRKQKLIPLMFEDITKLNTIRPSLKSILNTITYIIWPGGDPEHEENVEKFWRQLVRAMPRKRNPGTRDIAKSCRHSILTHVHGFFTTCVQICRKGTRLRKYSSGSDSDVEDQVPLIEEAEL